MQEVILKRFELPDEVRTFEKGRFELVHIGGMTIGRATYEPGWQWSTHVGKALGKTSCAVEHVGIVVSGCATAAMDDGRIFEMSAGDVFYIEPGHDSWVVGDEPYVSLHLMGASDYAAHKAKTRAPSRRHSSYSKLYSLVPQPLLSLSSEAVYHPACEAEAVLHGRAEARHHVVAGKAQSDPGGEIVLADQAGVDGIGAAIGPHSQRRGAESIGIRGEVPQSAAPHNAPSQRIFGVQQEPIGRTAHEGIGAD